MEITLASIADIVKGEISGDGNQKIRGAASFEDAKGDEITFASQSKFLKKIDETDAGAVIVPQNFQAPMKNIVQVDNPQIAFIKVLNLFHPALKPDYGISQDAYIGKAFLCGQDVSIAPFCAIGDNVTLGHRVVLCPNVVIGDNVIIGNDVKVFPNVTILERCIIGNRVTIHAGSVIGSDGFGFAPEGEKYIKIPHTGIVQIDNDVEIGAGNTIDRATFGKTWIQSGVKTDNLVQIGHNVTVGENSLLVGQVGISGSVKIGKNAILAGQAGIAGHLSIGNNAIVGPQAGVAKSVPDGETVSGSSAMPHRLWLRVQRILPKLPELGKKLSEVDRRLKKFEEQQNKSNGGENG
ncbi:MAG: UDP-3-O-(3-hydroxymyristoyl)glucosamine N-acyltransferase [Desulfobacteraceae bacterium]|jgi:UDP-3-O-[3-hydroxymyristoyl] glucosamine N-acyltransferase|nr:MAG: UDP-3-O-(3-hydroxymyristoyl)glucosamine N-acyltransferase [Desulfobacteraceae bacterium]